MRIYSCFKSGVKCLLCLTVLLFSQAIADVGSKPISNIPRKVVSINLCTDELAVQLAKPGQLQAVTFLVKNRLQSQLWKAAQSYQSHNNSLEQIISYKPDLVLASQYTPVALIRRLKSLGLKVYVLPRASTLSQIKRNFRLVGRQLGSEQKAIQLIENLERKLRHLAKWPILSSRKLDIVLYLPGGWSNAGKDLSSHLIKMAGMKNLALKKGFRGWSSISIEQLVHWNPDMLIIMQNYDTYPSQATALLQHPAIRYFEKHKRVVYIPGSWLSCGSPSVIKVLDRLLSARREYLMKAGSD